MKKVLWIAGIWFLVSMAFLIAGCEPHYEKVEGQWKWTTWDEGHGTRYWDIENVDSASFEIISKNYAKDKNQVYVREFPIEGANPSTFRLLEFPYSTDGKMIFCGNIPMPTADVRTFEVTNSKEGLHETSRFALRNRFRHESFTYLPNKSYLYNESYAKDKQTKFIGPTAVK